MTASDRTVLTTLKLAQRIADVASVKQEIVAVEIPVAIEINGITLVVLMASPYQLEELAIGFLHSEGLITQARECLDIQVSSTAQGMIIAIEVLQAVAQRLAQRRRTMTGATGCGLCGIPALEQAQPNLSRWQREIGPAPALAFWQILAHRLENYQKQGQYSGALHAAAMLVDEQLYVFEDVGRHNALDKLIGYCLRQRICLSQPVLMTSRLSSELVQKAIRSQMTYLGGVSAPTSMAIELASQYGLGLVGFIRPGRITCYTKIA